MRSSEPLVEYKRPRTQRDMELPVRGPQCYRRVTGAVPASVRGVNYFGPLAPGVGNGKVGCLVREVDQQQDFTPLAPPLNQQRLLVQRSCPALLHREMR